MTEPSLPETWSGPVDEMGLDATSIDPPDGESGEWFAVFSHFATRGFVRGLLGTTEGTTTLRLQFALPTGTYTGRRVLDAVCGELASVLGGSWDVAQVDPDWQLDGELASAPDQSAVAAYLRRLEDLAAVTDADTLEEADWLLERLEGPDEAETKAGADSDTASARETSSEERSAGADVFESIGDSEPGAEKPTPMIEEAGLVGYEIARNGDGLDIRIGIDVQLPVPDREHLGRALAHALRARYDLEVRPLPADDNQASLGESNVAIRAEPTDLGIAETSSPDEMRSQIQKYFDRIERFDGLGVKLADVLGISGEGGPSDDRPPLRSDRGDTDGRRSRPDGTDASTADRPDRDSPADRERETRDRPTTRDEPGRPTPDRRESRDRGAPSTSEDRPPSEPEEEGTGVVLDMGDGGESTAARSAPTGELEPGNYRDPRLLREDATTSLVDVVLRHPGYAEEKMAHNLSILLSIDYPEATNLVETAPCVIAWGVGHERGEKFKRVIEKAGGRVVLVEPDSLTG